MRTALALRIIQHPRQCLWALSLVAQVADAGALPCFSLSCACRGGPTAGGVLAAWAKFRRRSALGYCYAHVNGGMRLRLPKGVVVGVVLLAGWGGEGGRKFVVWPKLPNKAAASTQT